VRHPPRPQRGLVLAQSGDDALLVHSCILARSTAVWDRKRFGLETTQRQLRIRINEI
jgi:hypothetical protein